MPFFLKKKMASVDEIKIPIPDDAVNSIFSTHNGEVVWYDWRQIYGLLEKARITILKRHSSKYLNATKTRGCMRKMYHTGHAVRGSHSGGIELREIHNCRVLYYKLYDEYYDDYVHRLYSIGPGVVNNEYYIVVKKLASTDKIFDKVVREFARLLNEHVKNAEKIQREIAEFLPLSLVEAKAEELEEERAEAVKERENLTDEEKGERILPGMPAEVLAKIANYAGPGRNAAKRVPRGRFLTGLNLLSRKLARGGSRNTRRTRRR